MTYLAFEVGRSNLGDKHARLPMPELRELWNRKLEAQGISIRASYGHTGNYVIQSPLGLQVLSSVASSILERTFTIFHAAEVADFLDQAASVELPSSSFGLRLAPGAVMSVDPLASAPATLSPTERVVVSSLVRPRLCFVWKKDILRQDGRALDRKKRQGGWGAVARDIEAACGGRWTARSLRSIKGLCARADMAVDGP